MEKQPGSAIIVFLDVGIDAQKVKSSIDTGIRENQETTIDRAHR